MFMPQQLNRKVDAIAKQALGKQWQLYAGLLAHWEEIVGSAYAQCTTPVKISFPHAPPGDRMAAGQRTDGILTIRLPQGLVMEFTYQSERIRQRIATYFGYAAIAKITFDPVYGQKPRTTDIQEMPAIYKDNRLESFENPELAQALNHLGSYIHNQPKSQNCA